jgi:hypothetical protein
LFPNKGQPGKEGRASGEAHNAMGSQEWPQVPIQVRCGSSVYGTEEHRQLPEAIRRPSERLEAKSPFEAVQKDVVLGKPRNYPKLPNPRFPCEMAGFFVPLGNLWVNDAFIDLNRKSIDMFFPVG